MYGGLRVLDTSQSTELEIRHHDSLFFMISGMYEGLWVKGVFEDRNMMQK